MSKIYIYGTGGFAREVAMIFDDNKEYDKLGGFVDLAATIEKLESPSIMGKPVIAESDFLKLKDVELVIGVGDPTTRKKIVESLPANMRYVTVIHHSASVSRWAEIGEGSVICGGCMVTVNIVLGAHTHLNLNTTIGHDVKAAAYFTTAPSVSISGECTFEERVYFGTGAASRQGLSVAENSTIGMGAMLVKSATESGIYVGIPAKLLKR